MQGFNMGRYVPPDVEGTISGNALNKKHALGARASKLRTEGILTVRFEMPFAVWCGTCPKPTIIGQGVRFNAEKKKVGAYYSTPVWSFRMRHADCGGALEIRTDPAAAEYVVVEGGSRRDTGDDKDDSLVTSRALLGDILPDREKEVLRHDAFARLEKTIEDRAVLVERSHRIAELEDASERAWEDPYAQNRRLRAAFRAGRHAREREAVRTGELQARMSLGIDLLPATEEDARRAALVDFGVAAALDSGGRDESDDDIAKSKLKDAALTKPLFSTTVVSNTMNPALKRDSSVAANLKSAEKGSKTRLKSEIKASQTRESLASTITRNTRASQDPFLIAVTESRGGGGGGGAEGAVSKTPSRIQGIKRKRPDTHTPPQPPASQTQTCAPGKHPNAEAPSGKKEEGGPGNKPENESLTSSEAENTVDAGSGNSATRSKAALVEYDSD